jgi:hypothetical protein
VLTAQRACFGGCAELLREHCVLNQGSATPMRGAKRLVFMSVLLAARTIIFRLITKGFVRFASVALIAAIVQVSLISLPSAQTISAQTTREAPGSSLSETVQQIEGTYDGTTTLSQVTGEHQISLTFQQSGSEVTVTYRSVLGGRGRTPARPQRERAP